MRSDDCREDGITHIPGKAFHLFHLMHEAFCPQYPCTAAWRIWLTFLCVKAGQPTGFLLVTFMGKQHIYLPSFRLFHVADSTPGLAFLLQNRVWGSYSGVLMPTQCVSDDLAHILAAERMKVNIWCHDWSIPNICSCEEFRNWPTVHHIIFSVRHEVHLLLHLGLMQIKCLWSTQNVGYFCKIAVKLVLENGWLDVLSLHIIDNKVVKRKVFGKSYQK